MPQAKLITTVLASCIFFMMMSSTLYIINPAIAFGTIAAIALGPFCLASIMKKRGLIRCDLLMIFALVALVCFSVIAVAVRRTYPNLQYLKAFAFATLSFGIVAECALSYRKVIQAGVLAYAFVILSVALLQIAYIFTGIGLDPTITHDQSIAYIADNAFGYSGARSIFNNPNDFATILTLLIIYIAYCAKIGEKWKVLVLGIIELFVIFAGSRTCFAVSLVVLFTYYFRSAGGVLRVSLLSMGAIICCIVLAGIFDVDFANSYFGAKLSSILTIAATYFGGGTIIDNSVSVRAGEYAYFVTHLSDLGLGSFSAQDYGYFLQRLPDGALFSMDPHSLMVEMGVLYGYLGIGCFLLIIAWIYGALRSRHMGRRVSTILTLAILSLTFVSSSVINFPAFWILMFVIGRCAVGAREVRNKDILIKDKIIPPISNSFHLFSEGISL